ncbi:MAG: protein kinase domain-containing protein, partial [Bryobacteraceae bacterium]
DRMARFTREAKVLASLNHPHIAQIYGIEERALVMELVPGGTLKRPLPLETALRYAKQIAEALEAAHDKGIVHRDLKPANIMVTPEGVVKLLDFGLAAVALGALSPGSDPVNSPTLTGRPTEAGMILGTAAYMSPEQAAGQPVDKRADVWSFGVVLWEMLTGRRLFEGETVSVTLAAVLRGPIDFDGLPRQTPAAIRGLLRRCLDRNAKNRLRDIGEARVAIESAIAGETPLVEGAREGGRRPWLAWSVAGVAAAAGIVWFGFFRQAGRGPVVQPPAGYNLTQVTRDSGLTYQPSISADGNFVVYASDRATGTDLDIWLQHVSGGQPVRLTATPGNEFHPRYRPTDEGSPLKRQGGSNRGFS